MHILGKTWRPSHKKLEDIICGDSMREKGIVFRCCDNVIYKKTMEFNLLELPPTKKSTRDWELPYHILSLVADKLIHHIKDYIQFGAVCHSWRSVYIENRHQLPRQLPMLLLPTIEVDVDDQKRSFYSLIEKRIVNSQVSVPYSSVCRGSSHGWLVIVSINYSVSLFNPFMSVNNEIQLPSLTTFDADEWRYPICHYSIDCSDFLDKVILSANPASKTNYIAIAICGSYNSLFFCMPGDKAWTYLRSKGIMDVISYGDQFYTVNRSGQVFVWDLNHGHPMVSKITPPLDSLHCMKRYLVQSSGDLLQVLKHAIVPRFDVYKLDLFGSKWIKMDNLQGHVLFLGDNSSMSLSTADIAECKPNSIYFTDDDYMWTKGDEYGDLIPPHDMGVFSLEDSTVEPHYPMDSKMPIPVPIWIEPMLCE